MSENLQRDLGYILETNSLTLFDFEIASTDELQRRLKLGKLIEGKGWVIADMGSSYLVLTSIQFQKEIFRILKKE